MALPTSILLTKFAVTNYFQGPFLSSGGNVYAVLLDTTLSKLHAFKATDPTASFTEQDITNIPAQAPAGTVWVVQNGDVLSIAGGENTTTPAYKFHQFDMSTDLWSTTIKDKAIAAPTIVNSPCVSVIKRSDNSFIAVFNGALEKLMGSSFDRVSFSKSTDGGSTWTAETGVGATGVKRQITGAVAVLGASDRTHCFYSDARTATKHRSLSSADALDTEAAVTATGNSDQNYIPGIAYVSGANTVVKVPLIDNATNKLTNVFFNSGANPTISTNIDYTDAAVFGSSVNVTAVGCHAIDGTTTHSVWSDSTSKDLLHDSQGDAGSFGTDINEFAGTVNSVSANIYTRSGSLVLAYLMDDGGTVKYNEIGLAAAAAAPVPSGVFAFEQIGALFEMAGLA